MTPARPEPFATALLSEAGGRHENQDCAGFRNAGAFSCWVLADGLGGHHGGALAARLAVDSALEAFTARPGCSPDLARACLEAANAGIHERQQRDFSLSQMRSTAVVLVAGEAGAAWGHIGDSRLYYFHGGRIAAQTLDHSVPQVLAATGEISPAEIRFHEDRARLLRSLGTGTSVRLDVAALPQPVSPGDAFLLCTDGFWEYVTEDEMERDLAAAPAPSDWLGRMRERLAIAASPGRDNYSAIAIVAR